MIELPVETPRLRLRRLAATDLEPFVAYRQLEAVARYQGWARPYTHAHGLELIESSAEGPLLRPGAWSQIAIASRETDALLGDIGTHLSAATPRVIALGFTLAPPNQGQGFATEALRAWLEQLRSSAPACTFAAISDQRNRASKALLTRLGFELHHREVSEYFGESCIDEHFESS